ncbi:MAG TPA: 50S ribosomal protein L32 [Patescibacteria group bacterium]|jgi:large subunit ribosomal protein L32|nr:50S ribosomal protein L32 [Patescibacteria group bacterium]
MPVPKRKRSRVRRDKRFANKGIVPKIISVCKTCNAPLMPHIVCQECGHYKGMKVTGTKQDRAEKRSVILQAKAASKNKKSNLGQSENSQPNNNIE